MEWLKTSLDRVFGFLSALIPGAAVLLLLCLHHPGLAGDFWSVIYLEYKTKIAIVISCAFLAGWSVSSLFGTLLGSIGGMIGGVVGAFSTREPIAKPWQDANWRALLSAYLGKDAPENIAPVPEKLLNFQLEYVNRLEDPEQTKQFVETHAWKARADLNDSEWATWWRHLHQTTMFRRDPVALMGEILDQNFQCASILILCAVPCTPALKQWWLMSLCVAWVAQLVWTSTSLFISYLNPWSSYGRQMQYLQERVAKENHNAEDALSS